MRSGGSIISGVDLATYRYEGRELATMSSILWERFYPYVMAALLSSLWWFAGQPFPAKADALLGAAVTVASVFGGFLVAAKAVLISLKNSAIFEKLREAGYMDLFVGYLKEGINASVSLVIISMLGFFIANDPGSFVFDGFCLVWIFASLGALLTYWRVSNLLFKILKHT